MGANPKLQTNIKDEDAFVLSLKYQSKHVIMYELNEKTELNKELQKTVSSLEKKIIFINENNAFLKKMNDTAVQKNDILRVELIQEQNKNLRFKNDNIFLQKDNEELKSNNFSLKRKYDNLSVSYDGLLKVIKK